MSQQAIARLVDNLLVNLLNESRFDSRLSFEEHLHSFAELYHVVRETFLPESNSKFIEVMDVLLVVEAGLSSVQNRFSVEYAKSYLQGLFRILFLCSHKFREE